MKKIAKNNILENTISNFNPDENGLIHHGIFGLPFNVEESEMVLVPVSWEATVSYGNGTSKGPKSILDASQQIDLYNPIYPDAWKRGIAMADIPADIFYQNMQVRKKVEKYLDGYVTQNIDKGLQSEINNDCAILNDYVENTTAKLLKQNKIVGVVGGDHSVPLGYMKALAKIHKDFGVLHIDAHADLREAYEGLTYSHASIFYNVLKIKNISKLVQIGICDFSGQEFELIKKLKGRVVSFSDYDIRKDIFNGKTWAKKCDEIVSKLPKNVYISFDIDGLVPYLAPNTGTPVLGGFSVDEIVFLVEKVISSGRKIIGFDLCEVAPGKDEWDGNVGARVLYNLCLLTLKSNGSK
jgi:agmatinase